MEQVLRQKGRPETEQAPACRITQRVRSAAGLCLRSPYLLSKRPDLIRLAFAQHLPKAMVGDAFRGRNRWLAIVALFQILAFVGLGVLCAVSFFRADSTGGMIAWASGFIVCVLTVALIKVWYWMEFVKNSVLREVKRLELQNANLSRQLEQVKPSSPIR